MNIALKFILFFLSLVFILVGVIGLILPIIPGLLFLAIGLILLFTALPLKARENGIFGMKWIKKIRKQLSKEEFQMRLFTFIIAKIILVFLFLAIAIKNNEFTYYIAVMFPVFLVAYYIHKKIRLNLPLFILISTLFILHCSGGLFYLNGIRLYDTVFWFIRYDNIVHTFGSFVAVFFVYNLMFNYARCAIKNADKYLFVKLALMTMGIGTIVEMIEFSSVIVFNSTGVGDYFNNALDLVTNFIGAIIGSFLIVWYHKKADNFLKGKITSKLLS